MPCAAATARRIRTFLAHYQFEAIHPFIDGNGRVGRALLTLCAYQWSKLHRPWLYMSPYFDENKDEYIDLLFAVSTRGEWTQWLEPFVAPAIFAAAYDENRPVQDS